MVLTHRTILAYPILKTAVVVKARKKSNCCGMIIPYKNLALTLYFFNDLIFYGSSCLLHLAIILGLEQCNIIQLVQHGYTVCTAEASNSIAATCDGHQQNIFHTQKQTWPSAP
jgi:hypothetical protein